MTYVTNLFSFLFGLVWLDTFMVKQPIFTHTQQAWLMASLVILISISSFIAGAISMNEQKTNFEKRK